MLENVIEQFKERLLPIWDQIQDSEGYQQLKEKYDNLNPTSQKAVLFGGAGILVLIIAFSPLMTLSDSITYVEEFEAKRELTRELLRVSKEASNSPNLSKAPSGPALVSQIQLALQQNGLIPEQIESVSESGSSSNLIPTSLSEGAARVQLRKLTLRQIVEIGFRLTQVSQSLKMSSMKMTASNDLAGYFDYYFELNAIKIPTVSMDTGGGDGEADNPLQRKRKNQQEDKE